MRLIDADALRARWKAAMLHMAKSEDGKHPVSMETLLNDVEKALTVNAVYEVHGRWLEKTGRAECSACANECWADSVLEYNYCPNCGAKMDMEGVK